MKCLPSLLGDDPGVKSHDLECFGKMGSNAEGGYLLWSERTLGCPDMEIEIKRLRYCSGRGIAQSYLW